MGKYYQRKPEHRRMRSIKNKERYANDPAFREKQRQAARISGRKRLANMDPTDKKVMNRLGHFYRQDTLADAFVLTPIDAEIIRRGEMPTYVRLVKDRISLYAIKRGENVKVFSHPEILAMYKDTTNDR